MATTRKTLQGATQLNAASIRTVFNVGLFIVLLDDDIAYFAEDMVTAIGDRRRRFVAKQEAVLIYEAAEDLRQLLGRDFRDAVKSLGATEEQMSRLKSLSSDLHRFWDDRREFLGTVRNALAAHRDHDTLAYVASLEALEPLDVMRAAADLSQLLQRLTKIVTELAALTVGVPAVLRDMMRTSKKENKK